MSRACGSWALALLLSAPLSAVAAEDGLSPISARFVEAFRANDLEAMMALYAPDAVLYPVGGMEARGAAAIRAAWGGLLDAFTVKGLSTVASSHEVRGDVAVCWGRFSMTLVPKQGGDDVTMNGRFLDVAVRDASGKWLYMVDHASLPLPPSPVE